MPAPAPQEHRYAAHFLFWAARGTASVHALDEALRGDIGRGNFEHTSAAPLCAALIAKDLGDIEAGRRLAAVWDEARHRHGLPVGFVEPARTLGPASADHLPRQWDSTADTACLDSTASYTRTRKHG